MTVYMQQDAAGQSAAGIWARFNLTVRGVLFVFVYLFWVDVAYVVSTCNMYQCSNAMLTTQQQAAAYASMVLVAATI